MPAKGSLNGRRLLADTRLPGFNAPPKPNSFRKRSTRPNLTPAVKSSLDFYNQGFYNQGLLRLVRELPANQRVGDAAFEFKPAERGVFALTQQRRRLDFPVAFGVEHAYVRIGANG